MTLVGGVTLIVLPLSDPDTCLSAGVPVELPIPDHTLEASNRKTWLELTQV